MSGWRRLFRFGRGAGSLPLCNVVALDGVIASNSGGPVRRGISLSRVEPWLEKAFKSWKPAAVAVTINSPGGSPVQSDLVFTCIRRLAKETGVPVYTFAQDVAASGGYWLLCAGDKAVACPTSLVGSIGVVGNSFGATELLQRVGLTRRIYQAGASKSLGDPFSPETEETKAQFRGLLSSLHDSFKDHVRQARSGKLRGSQDELFSGKVFTGVQGKDNGLVDELGSMRTFMQQQLGPKALFRLCSERPGQSVFPLGRPLGAGLLRGAASYDLLRDLSAGLLDELHERELMARLGL